MSYSGDVIVSDVRTSEQQIYVMLYICGKFETNNSDKESANELLKSITK